ncbi:MAG: DMT family transporter [Salaquimonas sp.]|nr:DMT family transporter [Salaquimonas sp.]
MQPRILLRNFQTLPDNVKGAIIILIGTMFLVAMTTIVKMLGERLHVFQILFLRQVFLTAVFAPVVIRNFPGALKTERPGLQILRIASALVGMTCGFTAVIHIPLADATAISFVKAFFVTIFAIAILSEPVGVRRWAAVAIGFFGVIIMLQPGTEGFSVYGLFALAGAAGAGMVMVLIRLLTRTERTITIMAWQAIGVGVVMAVPGIFFWQWPTLFEWILIVVLGVVGYVGQLCNIVGYRYGEASVMAALDYFRLIYAVIFGYLIFSQLPGVNTWVGSAVIVAASLYTIHRESRQKQVLVRTPEGRGLS